MNLFERIFGKKERSAELAKDRLKAMLSCERTVCQIPDVKKMENEISSILKKYVDVGNLHIKTEHDRNVDVLEIAVRLKK